MGRYRRAVKNEFYLEALWVLYAMIEDRTSAFLYCLGFVSEENRSKQTKTQAIQDEWNDIRRAMDKKPAGFKNLGHKLDAILMLIEWSKDTEPSSVFQRDIQRKLRRLKTPELLISSVLYLNEWRESRNKIVHALFSSRSESAQLKLVALVEEGYEAIRRFDGAVGQLKRSLDVRAKYGIR